MQLDIALRAVVLLADLVGHVRPNFGRKRIRKIPRDIFAHSVLLIGV